MKVAVFVDKPLPGERPTGVGVAAFNMSLALSKRGLGVHYVCRGASHRSFSLNDNMVIHQVRNYSRDNLSEGLRVIRHGKPDVVHVHSSSALPSLILGRAICQAVVMHSHGDESLRPLRPALMRKAGMSLSHMVVAISEATKRDLVAHQRIPPGKIAVAYNGVDVDEFRPLSTSPEMLEKYGLGGFDKVVLSIGAVQKRKGQWRMIRCMPRLLRERPGIVYANIGSAYDSQYLASLEDEASRLGVSGHVKFLGGVPPGDMPLLVSSADICVHLASREGFGLAVVEEMACGKPVVASNLPALAEIVQSGADGFLVDLGDTEALTGTVETLLGDVTLARKIGAAARAKVGSTFTWDRTASRLMRIYEDLLE